MSFEQANDVRLFSNDIGITTMTIRCLAMSKQRFAVSGQSANPGKRSSRWLFQRQATFEHGFSGAE